MIDFAGQFRFLPLPFSTAGLAEALHLLSGNGPTPLSIPGSTAGGGKPDLPNAGFTAQANAFDTRNNYARSDFDRTQRLSASYMYEFPSFGSKSRWARGWNLSGFFPDPVRNTVFFP